jgi:Icc-related predicted phosphoesterase
MRVLASADVHGELSVYEWLVDVARQIEADVLILAGDLLEFDCEEQQDVGRLHPLFQSRRRKSGVSAGRP